VSTRLKEGLESAWQQIQVAIDMFLSASSVARGVMNEMLAEYKILTSQLFITELTLYYEEIVSKTGGGSPPQQGGQGVMLGPRHQASQDHS